MRSQTLAILIIVMLTPSLGAQGFRRYRTPDGNFYWGNTPPPGSVLESGEQTPPLSVAPDYSVDYTNQQLPSTREGKNYLWHSTGALQYLPESQRENTRISDSIRENEARLREVEAEVRSGNGVSSSLSYEAARRSDDLTEERRKAAELDRDVAEFYREVLRREPPE